MMEKSFTITLGDASFKVVFQGQKFFDDEFVKYYRENNCDGNNLEFLPGVFYLCEVISPKWIRGFIIKLLQKCNNKSETVSVLITILLEKWEKKKITLIFKNKRDNYSLYIDNELIYNHKKIYAGKELLFLNDDYELVNTEPEYIEIETVKILPPCQSGGEGSRCSLKGVFKNNGLLRTDTYNAHYSFFSEYEMHCLAMQSENIKNICKKCSNCMTTVDLMQNGKFIGPTKGNESDCLTLGKYDEKYIIQNGNHRACCAKVFGIQTVKAKVFKFIKSSNEVNEGDACHYINESKFDNKEILESFYEVFRYYEISDAKTREYLEKDGTDVGLIELLRI